MSEFLSNYSDHRITSGIIPDSFYLLLFQKLFRYNVRMPTYMQPKLQGSVKLTLEYITSIE